MLAQPDLVTQMQAAADPVRCRILRVLARQELTVSELCTVLQLPQSTVSRHLKTLADAGWIHARRDGTSHFYGLDPGELSEGTRGLWTLLAGRTREVPEAPEDDRRVEAALAGRRSRSRAFFASAAGQWDRLRHELFGPDFHLHALLGLLDESWTIGDLGCGTGHASEALAQAVGRVIAIDGSAEMLESARQRLQGLANVELRRGELEALPLEDESLDAAVMLLVLHYVPDPARALAEARRVLRPGGRLLVADMLPHNRTEYQKRMGHVWLGFSEAQIARHLAQAGFTRWRVRSLPPHPNAKGPGLFAATAAR